MTQSGHQLTVSSFFGMSAFGGKADVTFCNANVRLWGAEPGGKQSWPGMRPHEVKVRTGEWIAIVLIRRRISTAFRQLRTTDQKILRYIAATQSRLLVVDVDQHAVRA
jgi:hypothetical protein